MAVTGWRPHAVFVSHNPGRVFVIAEAGVNHNGSLRDAFALVDAAADAGADAVKFQSFRAETLVTANAPRAPYQVSADGRLDQMSLLTSLELDLDAHRALAARCRAQGIEFMSSPFCEQTLRMLVCACEVKRIKLGSGELTHGALLLQAARTGLPLIVSTGMSTLPEIRRALELLAFGFTQHRGYPTAHACRAAITQASGRSLLLRKVTLLHCTTAYPTPLCDVNLRAMDTLAEHFEVPVGYSDHTLGTSVAVAAVARGARVIEKHLTLDRGQSGPDHAASLLPDELSQMVQGIREVETALGHARKQVTPSEATQREAARRSLVVAEPIAAGEVWCARHLAALRPATGVSPMRVWDVVGTVAQRAYAAGDALEVAVVRPLPDTDTAAVVGPGTLERAC